MSHTKGGWSVGKPNSSECTISVEVFVNAEPYEVCRVNHYDGFPPGEQGEANARLIAAAPDLLEWLRTAVWHWEANLPSDAGPTELDDLDAAKKVIATFDP